VSVATTQLEWREQFHHARLAEHVTPYNGYGWGVDLHAIGRAVQTQAAILSYLDVFTMLAIVALVLAPVALFLPRAEKGAAAGH